MANANYDRVGILSQKDFPPNDSIINIGPAQMIDFDALPENAVSVINEGIVLKISIDNFSDVFQGFPVPGFGWKAILFAPRFFSMQQGVCFAFFRSHLQAEATVQQFTFSRSSQPGFIDLSAMEGVPLPKIPQSPLTNIVGISSPKFLLMNKLTTPTGTGKGLSCLYNIQAPTPASKVPSSVQVQEDGSLTLSIVDRMTSQSLTFIPCYTFQTDFMWRSMVFCSGEPSFGNFSYNYPLDDYVESLQDFDDNLKPYYPRSWYS